MYEFIRNYFLNRIERRGRSFGSPTIKFDEKKISVPGEDLFVEYNLFRQLLNLHAFYLPLPLNAFGVVINPDGTSHNMEGGLHLARPGLYKLKYVDRMDRFATTAQVSELARDGEKIVLKVLIRYRVTDPLTALRIDHPIEALIEHIQTDVAQYIRTHNHNDIADSPEAGEESRLLSFFAQRHRNRHPLSRAITIIGVELKEFMGDKEYVDLRRSGKIQETQSVIDQEKLERQKVIDKIQAEHKAAMDKLQAEHKANVSAMTSKTEAEKEALRSQILHESQKRDIEIENLRKQSNQRHELIVKAMDAISQALERGYLRNNTEMKGIIEELLSTIKEDSPDIPQDTSPKNGKNGASHAANNDKIRNLTSTLLNLLKTKK